MKAPTHSPGRLPLGVFLALLGMLGAGCSRPADKEARFLKRGKALLESKDYARAAPEFRSAIQVMPKDAEAY